MERFIVRKGRKEGWWTCTDTALSMVVEWRQGSFNGSQDATCHGAPATLDALGYARAMRQMADWLYQHHRNLL